MRIINNNNNCNNTYEYLQDRQIKQEWRSDVLLSTYYQQKCCGSYIGKSTSMRPLL